MVLSLCHIVSYEMSHQHKLKSQEVPPSKIQIAKKRQFLSFRNYGEDCDPCNWFWATNPTCQWPMVLMASRNGCKTQIIQSQFPLQWWCSGLWSEDLADVPILRHWVLQLRTTEKSQLTSYFIADYTHHTGDFWVELSNWTEFKQHEKKSSLKIDWHDCKWQKKGSRTIRGVHTRSRMRLVRKPHNWKKNSSKDKTFCTPQRKGINCTIEIKAEFEGNRLKKKTTLNFAAALCLNRVGWALLLPSQIGRT